MSDLLDRCRAWMDEAHPHARHLERTLDWLLELHPDASEATRIAAATHDAERAYPDPSAGWDSAVSWDSPEYNRWHQDRCADMVAATLADLGASEELVRETAGLVRVHEEGGWPQADLVQAADSLSFLETMAPAVIAWVEEGRAPRERAEGKLRCCVERISGDLPRARELAQAMLPPALSRVRAANAPDEVRSALALVRTGRMHRLARDRFPRMPLWPGHPAFEVITYRTPQGIRAAGDQPWGPPNDACLGFMSELVMGTVHSGAHIDAHAHMTLDDRWHGGSAATDLGDFGPLRGDATEIPPIWRRGVLYDVPGFRGVESLDAGEPVAAEELEAIEAASGVAAGAGDVALIRSGYLAHWPDPDALAAHRGAGPDLTAARLLADRGVLAVGSDTETFEVQPAPDRGTPANPQPVHTLLLIERGIYILESLDLEGLARMSAREFLFVALPLAIRGATGSMVDPVAIL
jgi:kynurenine formamidase